MQRLMVPAASSDPLMPSEREDHHWTTANLGEAAPGVLTPLALAFWGEIAERATRRAVFGIGVLREDELEPPADPADWVLRPFYGRLALQLEFMALVGDRMPGVTGEDTIRGMFGAAPATMTFTPTSSRYPAIAWKLPRAFITLPRRIKALATEQEAWWRASVASADQLDPAGARQLFAEAQRRFSSSSSLQLVSTMTTVQPLYDALGAIVERAGTGDAALLSGTGGAEMDVVTDIWRASRGEIDIADVVLAHGFHGPREGEVSARVWREDDTPLRALVERYSGRDDGEDPRRRERERTAALKAMQAEVVRALPFAARPGARLVLHLAAQRIPLRGVAKRSFLQAIDVARAAARRLGEQLADDGTLADPEDVFMFTGAELTGDLPPDAQALTDARRATRATYEQSRFVASEWHGLPELVPAEEDEPGDNDSAVSGIGVSPGMVEGTVRVVTDPGFTEVEPDEVLVAPTTDPSWSSIMFISSALVVDIGGEMSHAAVVARELGIPCVVGTGNGTRVFATGDRVRVDGDAGTVDVIERANGDDDGGRDG